MILTLLYKKHCSLFVDTVMLRHSDPNKRFYLQTDASKYALGGQLYQIDDDNEIGVIAFTSRVFRGAELNYFTTELELLSVVHCLKKFRTYVLGRPLTVVTDNKALTFMKKCQLTNSRMTRWILAIQEYDFDIVYCKGSENIVADILSRDPEDLQDHAPMDTNEELEINNINITLSRLLKKQLLNIGHHQRNDERLNKIINELNNDPNSKLNDIYTWYNNKLYRRERRTWKLIIATEISERLVEEIHISYGHIGMKRTYQLFKEHFTGDKVYKFTKHMIKTCEKCQKNKDHHKKGTGETKPMLPQSKGEMVSMDYYGPLPTSTSGVKYLLIIVDNFTKYVKLYPMKKATTAITINKLKQYIFEVGKPKTILTDNGTQFTSKSWTKNLEKLGIRPKYTPIRNPCTNLSERVNRQLRNLFRILVGGHHAKWAKYIRLVEECINGTYHHTIEITPHQAQWSQKPKRVWERFIDKELMKTEGGVNQREIYRRIKEKGEKRAKKHNEEVQLKFNIGDKVLVKTNLLSDLSNKITAKFCELYGGPYVVKELKRGATYVLANPNNTESIRGVFNTRQLKPLKKST